MARYMGLNCSNFPSRNSTFAHFSKPQNKYNGTYYYIGSENSGFKIMNATIESKF